MLVALFALLACSPLDPLTVRFGATPPATTTWSGTLDDPQFDTGTNTLGGPVEATLRCFTDGVEIVLADPSEGLLGGTEIILSLHVEEGDETQSSGDGFIRQFADFDAYDGSTERAVSFEEGNVALAEWSIDCSNPEQPTGNASGTFQIQTAIGDVQGSFVL